MKVLDITNLKKLFERIKQKLNTYKYTFERHGDNYYFTGLEKINN